MNANFLLDLLPPLPLPEFLDDTPSTNPLWNSPLYPNPLWTPPSPLEAVAQEVHAVGLQKVNDRYRTSKKWHQHANQFKLLSGNCSTSNTSVIESAVKLVKIKGREKRPRLWSQQMSTFQVVPVEGKKPKVSNR